jgi:S1-C subfamily serine protease
MKICTGLLLALAVLSPLGCDSNKKQAGESNAAQPEPQRIYVVQHAAARPPVMLGVGMEAAGPVLAKHAGVHETECTLITNVAPDTPAARAGLEDWDLVVKVDGSEKASPGDIRRVLRSSKPGDTITLTISRGGNLSQISATLAEPDHNRMTLLPAGEDGT